MFKEQGPQPEQTQEQTTDKNINSFKQQQDFTAHVEQFYQKPTTQAELAENMRILKELPEDKKDPKVIIKLGDPAKSHKFVLMGDEDKRKYVIALPIEKKAWHRDIAALARKLYKRDLHVIGGGYMHTEGEKLIVDGTSGDFGEAPKEFVKNILQQKFPELEIEAHALNRQQKSPDTASGDVTSEDDLAQYLEKEIQNIFHGEFYQAVMEEAVKLGCDYTKDPQKIEGADDLAYMVYSSENGSSFGFDTLYLGYRDEKDKAACKEIARERGYMQITEIKAENDVVNIKYSAGSKEREIQIPVAEIPSFEPLSDLDEIDQKLLQMYTDNQIIYETAPVFHGISH